MGFTAQEEDTALALINMRGRMYDPSIGRFLTVDPRTDGTSQGLNAYSYVANNPLSFTDPSGFAKMGNDPCPLAPGSDKGMGGCAQDPGSGDIGDDPNAVNNSSDSPVLVDPTTGQPVQIVGDEVTVIPKPPLTEDSNGPTLFGGSTAEALRFYTGNSSGGCGCAVPQSWLERQLFQHTARTAAVVAGTAMLAVATLGASLLEEGTGAEVVADANILSGHGGLDVSGGFSPITQVPEGTSVTIALMD
jgi:RHS repeat-associated protein